MQWLNVILCDRHLPFSVHAEKCMEWRGMDHPKQLLRLLITLCRPRVDFSLASPVPIVPVIRDEPEHVIDHF